jgi:hypothetical protein
MENTAHASDAPEAVEREQGIVRIHENQVERIINDHLEGKS